VIKIKHIVIRFFPLVFLGILSGPALANQNDGTAQIKGEALRAVFNQTMMIGEYREFRDVTRTYNYTEFHYQDGTTDYIEGRKNENGRWKIIGEDKICYTYPKSKYYTGTYCFFVFISDGCYYKFAPRNMTLRGPRNWDKWSSRAIRKGSGGSCAEPIG